MEDEDPFKVFQGFELLPRLKPRTHPVIEVLWVLASYWVAVVSVGCALMLMLTVAEAINWYRPITTPFFRSPVHRMDDRYASFLSLTLLALLCIAPNVLSSVVTGMRLKWWKGAILGMVIGVTLTLITLVIGEAFRVELILDPIFPVFVVGGLTGGLLSELRMD